MRIIRLLQAVLLCVVIGTPAMAIQPVTALPGWETLDHERTREAFLTSCPAIKRTSRIEGDAWLWACRVMRASALLGQSGEEALTAHFHAVPLNGNGKTTAYYVPHLDARDAPEGRFTAPLRGVPPDLVVYEEYERGQRGKVSKTKIYEEGRRGRLKPYGTRADIEAGKSAKDAPIIAYVRPEDKFFLQIQGSGHLTFPDGRQMRAAFAAHNGKRFSSLATALIKAGELPRGKGSNPRMKAWIREVGDERAQEMMNKNERYIFFQPELLDGRDPNGALSVPLTSHVSIALDPRQHRLGTMFFIEPSGRGAPSARLAVAQDVGGAIKGRLRSDLYFGVGDEAGRGAEVVNHKTTWWALVPKGSGPTSVEVAEAATSANTDG